MTGRRAPAAPEPQGPNIGQAPGPAPHWATYGGLSARLLDDLLEGISRVRVAVLGDLCLDVYWLADMRLSELSRETPHHPLPIVEERMSPGGGANVAANLAALHPARTQTLGLVGGDWRGQSLLRLLEERGVDTSLVASLPGVVTNAYCKPLRKGISGVVYEDPRLDFAARQPIGPEAEEALVASLAEAAPGLDALCVSDQLAHGVCAPRVREAVMRLAREGLAVTVDSRDRINEWRHCLLKPNELEAARAAGLDLPEACGLADCAAVAQKLAGRQQCEVVMTIGARGSLCVTGEEATHVPAGIVEGPIDIVGAGDTFLAGFTLATAAGASRPDAARLAGLASELTIRQIGVTGVATPGQIRQRLADSTVIPA